MSSTASFVREPRPQITAGHAVAVASGGLAGIVAFGMYAFSLPIRFALIAFGVFAVIAVCVLVLARRHLGYSPFGAANLVTLLRGMLLAPLPGLALEAPAAPLAWLAIALSAAGLALDGVDGRLARRSGFVSAFGARFDLEIDALLILVLSILCWQLDKAGAWIVAAGVLRYAFVAAARVLPWMRAPLPASRRRQAVCVVQIVALLSCLAPWLAPPASGTAGAVGLAVLAWSFGVDVFRLARNA